MHRLLRRLGAVAWPAFLGAAMLEVAVFAHVDPEALHGLDGEALGWSAQAVYSVAFFVFWLLCGVACALTWLLAPGRLDDGPGFAAEAPHPTQPTRPSPG